MFQLTRLGFDVLLHIFGTLDRCDIYSICLLSRAFDEIAAPVLYTAMQWHSAAGFVHLAGLEGGYVYAPCLAFRRRPYLRNHVRTVTFCSSRDDWASTLTKDGLESICEELCELPFIYSLRWIQRKYSHPGVYLERFITIVNTVAKLRAVRELYLPSIVNAHAGFLDVIDQPLTTITMRKPKHWVPVRRWLEQHRHSLRELNLIGIENEIDFTKGFPTLTCFSLEAVTNFASFVTILKELRQLKELKIVVNVEIVNSCDTGPEGAAQLDNLEIFIVTLIQPPNRYPLLPKATEAAALKCYVSAAEHSAHMQTLHISTFLPAPYAEIRADKSLIKIINNHGATIRSLRLDDMSATNETLMRLFSQCTALEELGIHATDQSLNLVPLADMMPLAATFQRLNLTLSHSILRLELLESQRFLSQATPQLRRISIRNDRGSILAEGGPEYVTWERRWIYDGYLAAPIQHTTTTLNSHDLWRDNR